MRRCRRAVPAGGGDVHRAARRQAYAGDDEATDEATDEKPVKATRRGSNQTTKES
jgi:hypothetical protein